MHLRDDATIELSEEERTELEKVARSRRTPQALAQRVRIVLMTADGIGPGAIGEQLGVSQPTVRKWRARYMEQGLPGLRSEPRAGRPRTLDDQRVADLLNQALQTRPAKSEHQQGHGAPAVPRGEHCSSSLTQLQVVQRPGLRREGARHHRPLPQSTRSRAGAVRR